MIVLLTAVWLYAFCTSAENANLYAMISNVTQNCKVSLPLIERDTFQVRVLCDFIDLDDNDKVWYQTLQMVPQHVLCKVFYHTLKSACQHVGMNEKINELFKKTKNLQYVSNAPSDTCKRAKETVSYEYLQGNTTLVQLWKNVISKEDTCQKMCSLLNDENPICQFILEMNAPSVKGPEGKQAVNKVKSGQSHIEGLDGNIPKVTGYSEKKLDTEETNKSKAQHVPEPEVQPNNVKEVDDAKNVIEDKEKKLDEEKDKDRKDKPGTGVTNTPSIVKKDEPGYDDPSLGKKEPSEDLVQDLYNNLQNELRPEVGNGNAEKNDDNGDQLVFMMPKRFDDGEASSGGFMYLSIFCVAAILCYCVMRQKKKILALLIEGRHSRSRRRPNTAAYSKLDCGLEEAMLSKPPSSAPSASFNY